MCRMQKLIRIPLRSRWFHCVHNAVVPLRSQCHYVHSGNATGFTMHGTVFTVVPQWRCVYSVSTGFTAVVPLGSFHWVHSTGFTMVLCSVPLCSQWHWVHSGRFHCNIVFLCRPTRFYCVEGSSLHKKLVRGIWSHEYFLLLSFETK